MLLEIGRIEPIRGYEESYLSIRTPDVLALIQRGDPSWEQMVPAAVAEIIKAENLFGWRPRAGIVNRHMANPVGRNLALTPKGN